jgi:hypothetical protein
MQKENVVLPGLQELQEAIPAGVTELRAAERAIARRAVANSLGLFCEVPPECMDNPENFEELSFSFPTADTVIDGLINSTIDWRNVSPVYLHETL